MATQERKRFVFRFALWLCAVLVAMAALDALALDRYFVAGLVGLLVLERTTAPSAVTPRWRVRVRRVILVGLLGFGAIVAWRLLRAVPGGPV